MNATAHILGRYKSFTLAMKMRDEFNRNIKETLSKRVGLYCSNPQCRILTIGPNSMDDKTTSIGVAAHITAASLGGPRYDDSLTAIQRAAIANAIWLCQSCAKLIDSDTNKYPRTLLEMWKTEAENEAEKRLSQKILPVVDIDYEEIFKLMPELIKEMAIDLAANPLLREVILQRKGWVYNHEREKLVYYYDDHDSLDNKIILLENNGLLEDIQNNRVKRYLITEQFVRILKAFPTD